MHKRGPHRRKKRELVKNQTNVKKIKNIIQKESQRVDITIDDFMFSLQNFQKDLQKITKLEKIQVILLIDEAQVKIFIYNSKPYFLKKLKNLGQGSVDDQCALRH